MKKVETATTNARPSKRQLRIGQKSARLEEDRRRAEEATRAAAAERTAARKAQQEADARVRAEAAATDETGVAEVETAEEPIEATAEV
jgi:hypothetical protein